MFSISFGEILLVATVGLVVIGPKRLPQAARFVGHLAGRVQRQIQSVKEDIKREMDEADINSIQKEYQKAADNAGDIFKSVRQAAEEASKPEDDKTADDKTLDGENGATAENAAFPPPHTAPKTTGEQTN